VVNLRRTLLELLLEVTGLLVFRGRGLTQQIAGPPEQRAAVICGDFLKCNLLKLMRLSLSSSFGYVSGTT
jgi:hypothetical protein